MSAIDVAAPPTVARWPSLHLAGFRSLERLLFIGTLAVAVGLIFLAPRLPLTDLPQHAAQVTLWRDLILGRSAWTDLVRINLVTPYLIGYGLTLPLTFVLSVEAAVRIVLCAALLGFVAGCVALRVAVAADRRLDWLFPVSFFCCAWHWGFFTFLVASPIALLFLLLAHRLGERTAPRAAAWLIPAGTGLLLSHGLMFVAMLPIGALMALWRWRRMRAAQLFTAAAPFAILSAVRLAFRLMTAQAEGAMRFDGIVFDRNVVVKALSMLQFVTSVDPETSRLALLLVAALLAAPLLLGCRLRSGPAVAPLLGLLLVVFALPSYAFQTAMLYHRFALFLLPFYALLFAEPAPGPTDNRRWAIVVPVLAAWGVLALQADRIRAFAAEAKPFETVLGAAEPNARALSLVFDRQSPASDNDTAYLHFPLWYQAEKGGFVDFNFAEYHPQVVRFQAGKSPAYVEDWNWSPARFDGTAAHLRPYRYIFLRGSDAELKGVMARAACRLAVVAADADWTLLERGACPEG